MVDTSKRYDVIVVGGGVAGCAAARELAPDRDVLVLERGQVAGEASGLAAGLVAPTLFYSDRPDVARHANAYFREFDGTGQFEFVERQRIELRRPEHEAAARRQADRLSAEGFPVTFYEANEAAERYPRFDFEGICGIVEYGDTGWLDPYSYTVSLRGAAERAGVTVQTGVSVERILDDNGAITGVETSEGSIEAPTVVVAAGWRTKSLVERFISIPVLPFKLQCVTLDPSFEVDDSFPIGRVRTEELYFRPEHNGTVLFGGGEYVLEEPDTTTIRGGDVDESFRNHVAFTVPEFLEGFERASLVDGWTGVDAATPDARPIIDAPTAAPDGLVLATGLNGIGMVNSPMVAAGVHSLVTGEAAPFDLEPFALDRYETIPEEFELYGTFEATEA